MSSSSKIMGIDFGLKRIGIALSDIMGFLASPYTTLNRTNTNDDILFIKKIIDENSIKIVVFGLPYEMSGSEGEIAIKTKEFAELLQQSAKVEIKFVDERLSSIEAEEQLRLTIKDWKKRKLLLDQVSASIILQSYLDKKGD